MAPGYRGAQGDDLRAEALVAAAIALGVVFVLGYVMPALRNPVALSGIPLLAGFAWWLRFTRQARTIPLLMLALTFALLAALFLISPSYYMP